MPSFEDRKRARDENARDLQRMFEKSGESREDAGRKAREMADRAAQQSDDQRRQG
jgi:hypothetical protein